MTTRKPTKPWRLGFMGTPDFARPALDALARAGHQIVRVYSQPPRRAGRGQRERPSPVHARAMEMRLNVATPATLANADTQAEFAGLGLDAVVVVAYGLILPQAMLEAPAHGCLNIHASLLPRWRGAAPIQRAILAGDTTSGVSIMQMDAGLDTGPILAQHEIAIGADWNAGDLHDALADLGAEAIQAVLGGLAAGILRPLAQPESGVTYAAKLDAAEGRIDWRQPAEALARQIRAFAPRPGAWFELAGERIKLLAAEAIAGNASEASGTNDANAAPGRALDDTLTVACGAGGLRLLSVQRAGKSAMTAADFLRGRPVPAGTRLG